MKNSLQFSVREWFLIVVIVAVALCYWQQGRQTARAMAGAYAKILGKERALYETQAREIRRARTEIQQSAIKQMESFQAQYSERLTASDTRLEVAEAKFKQDMARFMAHHDKVMAQYDEGKAELWYAIKSVLTPEQYADFERARQEYGALPNDVKRFVR